MKGPLWQGFRPRFAAIAGVLLVASIVVIAPASVRWSGASSYTPSSVRKTTRGVEALDANQRVQWTYAFPRTTSKLGFNPAPDPFKIVDLDGDGHEEILGVVALEPAAGLARESEGVYCWSSDGRLLWKYIPRQLVTFESGRTFGPNWVIADWLITSGPHKQVWVSYTDGLWWADFLAAIEPDGSSRVPFVHGGIIYRLADAQVGGRNRVFAAAISNQHASAALAVIDGDGPPGSWPQEISPYRCVECPAGGPIEYVLLPPSDFVAANLQPYNKVAAIYTENGGVAVVTNESITVSAVGRIFRFTIAGEPLNYSISDGYTEVHRALETASRLHHSIANCPDVSRAIQTRAWNAREGWRSISIEPSPDVKLRASR